MSSVDVIPPAAEADAATGSYVAVLFEIERDPLIACLGEEHFDEDRLDEETWKRAVRSNVENYRSYSHYETVVQRARDERHVLIEHFEQLGFLVGFSHRPGFESPIYVAAVAEKGTEAAIEALFSFPSQSEAAEGICRELDWYWYVSRPEEGENGNPLLAGSDDRLSDFAAFISEHRLWASQATTARRPRDGERADEWAARVAIPAERLVEYGRLWLQGGRNVALFAKILAARQPTTPPSFLVRGLIPRGVVTLLAGPKKTGKSTLLTELGVVVGNGGGSWAGFDVLPEACEGVAVLLAGEDNAGIIWERIGAMSAGPAGNLVPLPSEQGPIGDILAMFEDARVALLVVDPARKFLAGNEDDSGKVSEFFSQLEGFAAKKACAVVVVQHPRKDARTTNLADVAIAVRGSGVFSDRPRVILCMAARGKQRVIGIPHVGGVPQHNMPPSAGMFEGERLLVPDPGTLRHLPAEDGRAKPAAAAAEPGESDIEPLVLAALRGLLDRGLRATRTGKSGIFEQHPPELAGLGRAAVRAAVDRLAGEGRILINDDGGLSLQ